MGGKFILYENGKELKSTDIYSKTGEKGIYPQEGNVYDLISKLNPESDHYNRGNFTPAHEIGHNAYSVNQIIRKAFLRIGDWQEQEVTKLGLAEHWMDMILDALGFSDEEKKVFKENLKNMTDEEIKNKIIFTDQNKYDLKVSGQKSTEKKNDK